MVGGREALAYDHVDAFGTWTLDDLPPPFRKLDESVVEEEYTRVEG